MLVRGVTCVDGACAGLVLHDETVIRWMPTVLYWLFGASMPLAFNGFRKKLIRAMMGSQITLPEHVWTRLNQSWIGFFIVMGVLNLYVAYNFATDVWVDFKLFGGMGLMLLFVFAQAL